MLTDIQWLLLIALMSFALGILLGCRGDNSSNSETRITLLELEVEELKQKIAKTGTHKSSRKQWYVDRTKTN